MAAGANLHIGARKFKQIGVQDRRLASRELRLRLACRPSPARKNAMLRLPKMVTGAAVAATLLMLGIAPGHTQAGSPGVTTRSAEASRQLELLGKLLDTVRSEYVDKPDDEKLLSSAIKGILST